MGCAVRRRTARPHRGGFASGASRPIPGHPPEAVGPRRSPAGTGWTPFRVVAASGWRGEPRLPRSRYRPRRPEPSVTSEDPPRPVGLGILRRMTERIALLPDRIIDTDAGTAVADRAVLVEDDRIADV